jgi:hypothetical protein
MRIEQKTTQLTVRIQMRHLHRSQKGVPTSQSVAHDLVQTVNIQNVVSDQIPAFGQQRVLEPIHGETQNFFLEANGNLGNLFLRMCKFKYCAYKNVWYLSDLLHDGHAAIDDLLVGERRWDDFDQWTIKRRIDWMSDDALIFMNEVGRELRAGNRRRTAAQHLTFFGTGVDLFEDGPFFIQAFPKTKKNKKKIYDSLKQNLYIIKI